ncbi:MAG: hypothetical protein V2J55_05705 [Candidatus Competibacteraceae bacterium]|jgi:hypothetical protein|nr:hypothetical protein [Candidatus Competibacteraceae bacterium]
MRNPLLEKVEYKVEKTRRGTWRRFLYPNGSYFAEFKSHQLIFGLPLLHYTSGICPETGRRIMAKGIIAIGRLAFGIVAIGHAAFGVIAIGQLALAVGFGLGQASSGVIAIGQLALGGLFGIGQIATGMVVIAQFGLGQYVLAQIGFGEYVWQANAADPEAVEFFKALYAKLKSLFGLV